MLYAQSIEDCLACHSDRSMTMSKGGREVSIFVDGGLFKKSTHADLGCVSCHEGFDPTALPHARRLKAVDCTTCHSDSMYVNFDESMHGKAKLAGRQGLRCADCHSPHSVKKVSDLPVNERHAYSVATCKRCHASVEEAYMKSDHGLAITEGLQAAPVCTDCHGEHDVKPALSGGAKTSRVNEAKMCEKCHLDNPEVRSRMVPSAGFIASYETSTHARAMRGGNELAATCSDCHGSHEMKKGSNPESKVNRKNIAATCGQCHGDIQEKYLVSIHGTSLAAGAEASATCTDCHGEHNILSPSDPKSPVAPANVSARVCTPCHASVRLTAKYGLSADRFRTFDDSYHGLASRAGSVEVANCASCHGVHDILPSSDPKSSIHKANLAKTCGECHPGANENFTKGTVHVIAAESDDAILRFVSTAYISLIGLTIGGMAFHNILDFIRKSRRQLEYRRGGAPRPHHGKRLYVRMNLNERIQHGLLLVSFITLVLTGFALRYPDAWWVAPFRQLIPWAFELRGIIHRVAGVVMVATSLYHVYYLVFVPRGKELLRDMLPTRKDITDVIDMFRYNLGFRTERPLLDRFSYIEKAEYWALIWGTAVMAITGFILWFDNTFLGILTKLGWDVARTVHYYEAWLATLAIIVWHFYFVIFNPDSYPLNLAFWKGTLTEEEMAEEHPLELERIRRREAEADAVVEAAVQEEEREPS